MAEKKNPKNECNDWLTLTSSHCMLSLNQVSGVCVSHQLTIEYFDLQDVSRELTWCVMKMYCFFLMCRFGRPHFTCLFIIFIYLYLIFMVIFTDSAASRPPKKQTKMGVWILLFIYCFIKKYIYFYYLFIFFSMLKYFEGLHRVICWLLVWYIWYIKILLYSTNEYPLWVSLCC